MAKKTHMELTVSNVLCELKRHHGSSWDDLSDTQRQEKLAARLFFMVCQSAHLDADTPLARHIVSIQNAFVSASL